jgi:glycerate dehydrogenase
MAEGEKSMKIVVLDGYTLNPGDNPWTEVEALGEVVIYDRTPPEQVIERSKDADILIINKVKLSRDVLEQLPNLKYITIVATGFDVVDIAAAKEHCISVSNVPVYGTDSVAQHVFAMLLHFCHRITLHDEAVRAGEWTRCPDFCFWKTPLTELVGKTFGIIGFGRIGRRTGEVANAFGMEVLASDVVKSSPPGYDGFSWATPEEIAERSDVISLHCPLTSENRGMVNREFLNRVKPNCILINASRGPLIVDQDLADALNNDQLAGAAVDVVSEEPIRAGNPLLSAKNCLITPHIAWATQSARKRLMGTTVENIKGFQEGAPKNLVNP